MRAAILPGHGGRRGGLCLLDCRLGNLDPRPLQSSGEETPEALAGIGALSFGETHPPLQTLYCFPFSPRQSAGLWMALSDHQPLSRGLGMGYSLHVACRASRGADNRFLPAARSYMYSAACEVHTLCLLVEDWNMSPPSSSSALDARSVGISRRSATASKAEGIRNATSFVFPSVLQDLNCCLASSFCYWLRLLPGGNAPSEYTIKVRRRPGPSQLTG